MTNERATASAGVADLEQRLWARSTDAGHTAAIADYFSAILTRSGLPVEHFAPRPGLVAVTKVHLLTSASTLTARERTATTEVHG